MAVPKALCLACGNEHPAFYASMAHDCRIDLAARKPYEVWLEEFRKLGFGVLRSPLDCKFPTFDHVVSGRQMLTEFLQSNIDVTPFITLQSGYYSSDEWVEAGFSFHPTEA